MKPAPFSYAAPRSVDEALDLLARHGADARLLAGGQTLGPMLNMRIATPSVLIDMNRIGGWKLPRRASPQSVLTHALVRQREGTAPDGIFAEVPLARMTMPFVGHYQTRNRGTICGSIAHGDPTAELPLALLVLDGTVHLASAKRSRAVPARNFYIGPLTTERAPEELVLAVEWPILADTRFAFHEVGVHGTHSTLCAAAVAMRTDEAGRVADLRVGLTAIADRPLLLDTAPFIGELPGAGWRLAICEAVRSSLGFVSDMHASADYRRHVAGVLTGRCLAELISDGTEER